MPAGSYQVTLKFAETYWSTAGKRIFGVSINGLQVLVNFDITGQAGTNLTALDKVFNGITPDGAGKITIHLGPSSADHATIDAIEIIPSPPTPTVSPTPTSSPTITGTFTITETFTITDTFTISPTPSDFISPTETPTFSMSPTPTSSRTATPTFSLTATPSASPGTPSPTFSHEAAVESGGSAGILAVLPLPNPQSGPVFHFGVKLSNATGRLRVRLYAPSMKLVAAAEFAGAWKQGWNQVAWPLPGIHSGIYHVYVTAGLKDKSKIATLYVLR